MFTPRGMELERGWPGRIDGDRVIQLAAQTLQAFFTGGGGAREHAEYPLAEVDLRAPVLYPPSVRVFAGSTLDFAFANTASIYGPEDEIPYPDGGREHACGWVQDKFGLAWQITPNRLMELLSGPDKAKAGRVMGAMMTMMKINIAALEAAAAAG